MQGRLLTIIGLIAFGIVGRLIPHLPNATPITAVSVAASRSLGYRWAVIIPLSAMIVSDLVIGLYDWRVLLSVYISIGLIGLLSASMATKSMSSHFFSVIGSSLLFFIVTNFTVWLTSPWYEKSLSGLLYAYQLGLPFYRSMLIGDLLFTPIVLCAVHLAFSSARYAQQRFAIA
jgi:hypothetical protein